MTHQLLSESAGHARQGKPNVCLEDVRILEPSPVRPVQNGDPAGLHRRGHPNTIKG